MLVAAAVGLATVKIHTLFQSRKAGSATKQEAVVAIPATETIFSCKKPKLPTPIKVMLDRKFPGWQFPEVSDEDCLSVKELSGPEAYPELIQGDFDGDGRNDYAVLIEESSEANDKGLAVYPVIYIVAFLNRHKRFKMAIVTHEGGGCLQLLHQGASDFNYEAQREFTYSNDTIFSGAGMGGMSYLYENGKFRAIITSD
jgi:hypothetical protein